MRKVDDTLVTLLIMKESRRTITFVAYPKLAFQTEIDMLISRSSMLVAMIGFVLLSTTIFTFSSNFSPGRMEAAPRSTEFLGWKGHTRRRKLKS